MAFDFDLDLVVVVVPFASSIVVFLLEALVKNLKC